MVERDATGRLIFAKRPLSEWLREAGTTTPAYVYDIDAVRGAARALRTAFGELSHLVAYAVKANSAGPILRALRAEGCGADVVSGAELAVALASGIAPDDIVFSGVAKRDGEIDRALGAGPRGIAAIQVESVEEIDRVGARARATGRRARISVRINPNVLIDTHAHVATGHDAAKFGVAMEDLGDAWQAIARHTGHVDLVGVSSHVGSTQTATGPYLEAARKLFGVVTNRLAAGAPLSFVDAGGGFGIDYGAGCSVVPGDFARGLLSLYRERGFSGLRLVVEPGRSLVAPFGILITSVIQTKHARSSGRRWVMIDAGMNDLIRPALYQARHRIESTEPSSSAIASQRVVGPICESSDDFGAHELPLDLAAGDLLAIRDAGAYGFTMASAYNGRALPAEIFVEGGGVASLSPAGSVDAWIESRVAIRGHAS
jgi:diaminopimelate decarboxylase